MFNLFITNPNVCCVIKLVSELITLSSSIICVAMHSTHLVGICQLRMNTFFFFVSLWYCVIYIIGFDNFCSRITAVVTSKGKELIVTLMNRSCQVIAEGWLIDALWSLGAGPALDVGHERSYYKIKIVIPYILLK